MNNITHDTHADTSYVSPYVNSPLLAFIPSDELLSDDNDTVCVPDGGLFINQNFATHLLTEFNTLTEISESLTGQACYIELMQIEMKSMPGFVYLLRCKHLDEYTPFINEAKSKRYPGTTNFFLFDDMRTAWEAMKWQETNIFDLFQTRDVR